METPPLRHPLARNPACATRRFPAEDRGRRLAFRGAFERDRDRLINSRAFRRLGEKGQLFAATGTRQVRTRLTHTLEIASAARTLARHLGLDEDLAEALALAHDVGQPPFGAAGCRALARFVTGTLSRRLPRLADAGDPSGFLPAVQALRVVELLEVRYEHPGLNLTDDVRDGLFKLAGGGALAPPDIDPRGLSPGEPASLEAQAVAAAMVVVTPLHDLEDGLAEGALELADVRRLAPAAALVARLEQAGAWPRGRFRQHAALHRALVHAAVGDVLVASRRRLARAAEDPRPAAGLVAPSPRGAEAAAAFADFVLGRIAGRPAVRRADARAERTIEALSAAVYRDPRLLDDAVLLRYKDLSGRPYLRDVARGAQETEIGEHYHGQPRFVRLVADHIAGMTDRFACDALEALVPGRSSH